VQFLQSHELFGFLDGVTAAPGALSLAEVPNAFVMDSGLPGPRVLVFGGIHGNERGGWQAVAELIRQFCAGSRTLERGSLTLAIGNLPAIQKEVRYVSHNLNRLFRDELNDRDLSPEHRRAAELRQLIGNADFLLDLHATTAPSLPFLMCEEHLIADARSIGAERIVVGWGTLGEDSIGGDTETYALSHGVRAFTMENGQWCWEQSANCALDVATRFLTYTGVEVSGSLVASSSKIFRLFEVQNKVRDGFLYQQAWSTFDRLAAHQVIGYDSVEKFLAPKECVIIMPGNPERLQVGEDLYLLAEEVSTATAE
jgi:predicted deacylase